MSFINPSDNARTKLARLARSLSAIAAAMLLLTVLLVAAQAVAQGTLVFPTHPGTVLKVVGGLDGGGLGYATASGDVNGDGYDDLVVSAPFATVVSGTEIYTGSGVVYLILGRPGLSNTWNLSTTHPNVTFYGDCPNVFACPEWVGIDVALGDINGDELDDIIIGTEQYGGAPGAAMVFVGRSTLTTTDQLTVNIKSKASATQMGYNLKIAGAWSIDRLGNSVASGDVNNDGYDDLIVGAYRAGPDASSSPHPPDYQRYHYAAPVTRTWAGAMYISLGASYWVSDNATEQDLMMCLESLTVYGEDDGDFFGRSVASGDVNGDGYADVIVGAEGGDGANDSNPITDSGEVYVFWGSDVITHPVPSECPADVYTTHLIIDLAYTSTVHTDGITIGHSADITIYGASTHDIAGWDVSSGDLNGDGYDDIFIGAPGDTDDHPGRYGKVYVIYGGTAPAHTLYLSETADLTIVGAALDDRLGESVSAADLNGDGYDDLIVSAIRADYSTQTDVGKTYVFYGSGSDDLWGTIYLSETDAAQITFIGDQDDDNLGKGLGAGDVNHDGVLDLLAGAPYADYSPVLTDTGILYALAGDAARGITMTAELTTVVAGETSTYTLAAWNQYSQWDATAASTFTLEAGAGGNCVANVCSPTRPGDWFVRGTFDALSDTAPLTVEPAALDHVLITPTLAVLDPGQQQQFTAQGYDAYNNAIAGLSYGWSVLDSDAGTINASGLFTAGQSGVYNNVIRGSTNGVNALASVNVNNLAPTAVISGTPLSGYEGTPLTCDGSPSYNPGGSIVSYAWDWDYTGSFVTDTVGVTATTTYIDDGVATVALQVIDNYGGSDVTTTLVTIANVPPTVDLGGPYATALSQTVILTPSVSDPGVDDTFTYAWDLDDDGDFDDATTPTAVFSSTASGLFTVSLQVSDDDGGVGSDYAQIVAGNVPPVAVIAGVPIAGAPGVPILFDGSPSYDIAGSIVAYAWDWDYASSFVTDTVAISTTHQWDNPGTFTVALRVTDDQGATGLTTTQVDVRDFRLFLPLVLRNQ